MDNFAAAMLTSSDGISTMTGTVATCPNCRVSVTDTAPHTSGGRQRVLCPYCGSYYHSNASRLTLGVRRQTMGIDNGHCIHQLPPNARHMPHDHELFPQIVHGDHRNGPLRAFGDFLAGRFGLQGSVTHFTGVMIRPSPEISLPPITRNSSGKLVTMKGTSNGFTNSGRRITRYDDLIDTSDEWSSDYESPPPLEYPMRHKTKEEFAQDVRDAWRTRNYDTLNEFYLTSFSSFQEINATFKIKPQENGVNPEDPALKEDLLDASYEKLNEMPTQVRKCMLKAMVNALIQRDKRLYFKDDVRAAYILLQNPLFGWQSSYPVLAQLMRFVCTLPTADQHLLMGWLKSIHPDKMRLIVKNLLQFLTVSQFSRHGDKLLFHPPRKWWIPISMKVLAMINAVNNMKRPTKIPYTEFYNSTLDHLDLMTEYYNWQNPDRPNRFSYCQYPFVLSIVAKRSILQKDSEHQMIINARKSLVATIIQNEAPNLDIFFFNISVRRSNLVSDSLNEIARKQKDLKKKLRVTFVGEPGLDMGGLTKEWFLLLVRQIFDPDYGMFVYHEETHCYWFSLTQTGNLREYNLIGVLMGLAVYNSIILDVHFPFICYKKLLSPAVVPQTHNVPVGACGNCNLEDLAEILPAVAQSLKNLLAYEGNVEEDFGITFEVSVGEYGRVKTHNLKSHGDKMPVTNENRQEFVNLYIHWIVNRSIYEPFKAFYLGFHSVCASNALIMLRPEEVEILVCGSPTLDLKELKKVTVYENCLPTDQIIRDFWQVVQNFSSEDQKKVLLFTTGTDRIPVGGVSEMTFKITAVTDRTDMLPVSHTCFNQLVLPRYENRDILRKKLVIAINNAEGFGLE